MSQIYTNLAYGTSPKLETVQVQDWKSTESGTTHLKKKTRNSYISRISIQMCIFKDTSLTSGESNPSSLLLVISTVSRLAERFSSKVLLHPFLLPCPQHMSQSLLKPTLRLTVFDKTTKIQPASAKNAGWTWPLAFMTNDPMGNKDERNVYTYHNTIEQIDDSYILIPSMYMHV